MSLSPAEKTRAFLAVAPQFRLGDLVTEQPHPLTTNLSDLAKNNLPQALSILHRVDEEALRQLARHGGEIEKLAWAVRETLEAGGRIFLCGCGATGRLSLVCETLWRQEHRGDPLEERVVAFMAGGDAALIRSVENFEDHPDYGERQLADLGFGRNDLFLGITEGGETPFVIGATLKASERSSRPPFFLYCNPDDLLCRAAERSARVIRDPRVNKINLTAGPMAVAGSTRMQASTVLMAAAGAALLFHERPGAARHFVETLPRSWDGINTAFLAGWIECESSIYENRGQALYFADPELAISILTDTTERAPTFSMRPFENAGDPDCPPSICHLVMPGSADGAAAWHSLLWREPRPLDWEGFEKKAGAARLRGFDFSARALDRRSAFFTPGNHCIMEIAGRPGALWLKNGSLERRIPLADSSQLLGHLVLKMVLNAHSTLVMGRLSRYDGNIMTWVKPANNKLIDRAIRCADLLLQRQGIRRPYDAIALAVFECLERLEPDQSLVHAVVRGSMFQQRQP